MKTMESRTEIQDSLWVSGSGGWKRCRNWGGHVVLSERSSFLHSLSLSLSPSHMLPSPSLYCSLHDRPINQETSFGARNRNFIQKASRPRGWWTSVPKNHFVWAGCQFLLFIYFLLIYFWLCWVFVAVHRLLIAVASLVVEHGLQARGLQQLWLEGSRVQAQQLWRTGLVAPWHLRSSWTRA